MTFGRPAGSAGLARLPGMRYLWALCWLAGAALLLVLGGVDYLAGTITDKPLGLAQLGSGLLACLIALAGPALSPVALPLVSLLPAATTLAATVLTATDSYRHAPFALAATVSLCWLIALTAWRGRTVLAVITVPLVSAAVELQPVLPQRSSDLNVIAALALAL